jgi:hypothetical protein
MLDAADAKQIIDRTNEAIQNGWPKPPLFMSHPSAEDNSIGKCLDVRTGQRQRRDCLALPQSPCAGECLHNWRRNHGKPQDCPCGDYVQSAPLRKTIIGNLPGTFTGVQAMEPSYVATLINRDVSAFQKEYGVRIEEITLKVPFGLDHAAHLAFRSNGSMPRVRAILCAKPRDEMAWPTEYWIEGGGVLCKVEPCGSKDFSATMVIPKDAIFAGEAETKEAVRKIADSLRGESIVRLPDRLWGTTTYAPMATPEDQARIIMAAPPDWDEKVWQNWRRRWNAATPEQRAASATNPDAIPKIKPSPLARTWAGIRTYFRKMEGELRKSREE